MKEPSSSDSSQSPARERMKEKVWWDDRMVSYTRNLELLYLINIYWEPSTGHTRPCAGHRTVKLDIKKLILTWEFTWGCIMGLITAVPPVGFSILISSACRLWFKNWRETGWLGCKWNTLIPFQVLNTTQGSTMVFPNPLAWESQSKLNQYTSTLDKVHAEKFLASKHMKLCLASEEKV